MKEWGRGEADEGMGAGLTKVDIWGVGLGIIGKHRKTGEGDNKTGG